MIQSCEHCGHSIPLEWERCPHCARPGLFSNVRAAAMPEEVSALEERYKTALEEAEARGCEAKVLRFGEKAASSRAVLNRSALEAARLASSERELQATFYDLLKAKIRLPRDNHWDRIRRIADEALFTGYRDKIRFAALSLDGAGLFHYGECSLELREDMIAHRASVFEENSTLFLQRHNYEPPHGYRAVWPDRSRLCVAKLASQIKASSSKAKLDGLLLSAGRTSENDQFIEVHVWGPLCLHCLKKGIFRQTPGGSPTLLLAVQELFLKANLDFEVQP